LTVQSIHRVDSSVEFPATVFDAVVIGTASVSSAHQSIFCYVVCCRSKLLNPRRSTKDVRASTEQQAVFARVLVTIRKYTRLSLLGAPI